VDPGTHALASLALARGFFPRRSWSFILAVVLAGTLADLDLLSLLFGPGAYLSGRNTLTHSLLGTVVVIAIAASCAFWLRGKNGASPKAGPTSASEFRGILLATFVAAILHLAMDLATSSGIAIFWPFRRARFAWDFLPSTDPWILALLVTGILLPELFALVGSEIGAKDKAPRGRNGALVALALIVIYVGARITIHGNAAAQLDAHSYHGESPRRVAALPDSLSLFTWHGIVETTSQICTMDVPASSATRFDPEAAACVHKPEPSPSLTAAQQAEATQQFLVAARFPKASVGSMESGSQMVVRDMRDTAEGNTSYALAARVLLDPAEQITSQHIVWARDVHLR